MQTPQIIVRLNGATDAELLRAGLAAKAVFDKAGVTPLQAAEASFARDGYDLSGFDPEHEGYNAERGAGRNSSPMGRSGAGGCQGRV